MQIARSWRQQASNLRLVGTRCLTCKTLEFPERVRCPKCGGKDLEEFTFCGRATVSAITTVYEAPRGFAEQVPYLAALVQLEEGPFVSTMLTDLDHEDAIVGMPVSMVTRRLRVDGDSGLIAYAYKFAPRLELSK